MDRLKIALVTQFSPDIGGGAVQLKSLLPELQEFDITWYYLSREKSKGFPGIWLGPPLLGESIKSDVATLLKLFVGMPSRRLKSIVRAVAGDILWIVGMNEGVFIAAEAHGLNRRVHLTIHDDPVDVFARSRRFRLFTPIMKRRFKDLLDKVMSLDVTSEGMRNYYARKYGVNSSVIFRYIPALPKISSCPMKADEIRVGHIGTLYNETECTAFLSALQKNACGTHKSAKLITVGNSREMDKIEKRFPNALERLGDLSEDDAISVLSKCDFLYCMYPQGKKSAIFRQTSQPIKLTTYLMTQRPIFAHTPSDSTLANIISRYGIGQICSSSEGSQLDTAITNIVRRVIPKSAFEVARDEMFGFSQITSLKQLLQNGIADSEIRTAIRANAELSGPQASNIA